MREKLYKINYKNGKSLENKACEMWIEDGKLYQLCKAHPFDNIVPSVLSAKNIKNVELIKEV